MLKLQRPDLPDLVPLVRCTALPMFEGHPLALTATLEASQVEVTVLHRNGSYFDLTRLLFCVPADSIQQTGQLATLTVEPGSSGPTGPEVIPARLVECRTAAVSPARA